MAEKFRKFMDTLKNDFPNISSVQNADLPFTYEKQQTFSPSEAEGACLDWCLQFIRARFVILSKHIIYAVFILLVNFKIAVSCIASVVHSSFKSFFYFIVLHTTYIVVFS